MPIYYMCILLYIHVLDHRLLTTVHVYLTLGRATLLLIALKCIILCNGPFSLKAKYVWKYPERLHPVRAGVKYMT